MSVTIDLSSDEVAQIKRFTELENENEAVTMAAREYLRVVQLRGLKAMSGKVDYQDSVPPLLPRLAGLLTLPLMPCLQRMQELQCKFETTIFPIV